MFTKAFQSSLARFVLMITLRLSMLGLKPAQPVLAKTLTVTNTNDSGAGSLRQAVTDAVSGDTITFNPSLSGQTIVLSTTLVIDKDLAIGGSVLASQITISGDDLYRVFYINSGVTVTLDSLIIAHGKSPYGSSGGGIFNEGGIVTIIDSTLSYNNADMSGGGVYSQGGTVTVSNSTVSHNNASTTGGGIYNAEGTVMVSNSTFAYNSGDPQMSSYAGGIYNIGTLTISDSIFANNSAQASGGGIVHVSGTTATVHVTIGGLPMTGSPFTLLAGASLRRSFPGIDKGPVRIESDVDIVAAERVIYKAAGNLPTSFSEMMALPNGLLDTIFWLPWYNNKDLDTQLRFGVP